MVSITKTNTDIEDFTRSQMLERLTAIKLLSTPFRVNDVQVSTYPAEYKVESGIEELAEIFQVSDRIAESEKEISDRLIEREKRFTVFGVTLIERQCVWKDENDDKQA